MAAAEEFVYEQNVVVSEDDNSQEELQVEKRCHATDNLKGQGRDTQYDGEHQNISAEENTSSIRALVTIICACVYRRYGILLAFCTGLCFSFTGLLLAILTTKVDPFFAVFLNSPVIFLGTASLLLFRRIRPPEDRAHYCWLVFSGICFSSNQLLFAFALRYIDVGDAITITYTSLLQVPFFSWIILKERLKMLNFVFPVLAFTGVVFISRPTFLFRIDDGSGVSDKRLVGILSTLCVSVTFALLMVAIRKQSMLGIHSFTGMCFNAATVLFLSGIVSAVLNSWNYPDLIACLTAVGVGLSLYIGQISLHFALKVESTVIVNMNCTTEIVFAFLWQFAFLHNAPLWTSIVGATLVIAASIGISLNSEIDEPNTTRHELETTSEQGAGISPTWGDR